MKQNILRVAFSSLFALTAVSEGSFLLVDNFETYTAGAEANGTGGWTANSETTFEVDPSNASNMVLRTTHDGATTNVFKAIPTIADGTTGTVFFRARATSVADFVLGTSDKATPGPGSWNDFEGYMRFSSAGDTNGIDVRDGGGFADAVDYTPDEWYNIWLVLDHTTDTTSIYVNQGSGDAGAAAASGAFRTVANDDNEDLINLFIRGNSAGNPGFVDDIYVDNTGANLTNPSAIPEPATSLLALLGLAFGMRRRRS